MTKVNYIGKYDTSFGTAFIVEARIELKVGQEVIIDDKKHIIKSIKMQSSPNTKEYIALFA